MEEHFEYKYAKEYESVESLIDAAIAYNVAQEEDRKIIIQTYKDKWFYRPTDIKVNSDKDSAEITVPFTLKALKGVLAQIKKERENVKEKFGLYSSENALSRKEITSVDNKITLHQIALYHIITQVKLTDTKAITVCEQKGFSKSSGKTLMKHYRELKNDNNIYNASPADRAERNRKKKDFENALSLAKNDNEKKLLKGACDKYLKEYNKVN